MNRDERLVVVGYDGRAQADDAAELARELARLEAAEVVVVASFSYNSRILGDAFEDRLHADTAPLFAAARERLGDTVAGTVEAGGFSPAEALTEVARRRGANLIVVGSTHRGAAGRIYPGSVAERLLSGAPCAVAIAPRGYADREHAGLGLVGVGYDGSAEADLALRLAQRLAREMDGRLRLIRAVPPLEASGKPPSENDLRELALRMLNSGLGGAVEIDIAVEEGVPAEVLAGHGVELDVLVIGSRSYGPLRHTLLGGVSAEVIRTAACPVIVVPRSAAETGERRGVLVDAEIR